MNDKFLILVGVVFAVRAPFDLTDVERQPQNCDIQPDRERLLYSTL